jgi:hypothetical protein
MTRDRRGLPGAGERRALRRLGEASAVLFGYPNVEGVGVGLRRQNGALCPELCYVVHVRKKEPGLPPTEALPKQLFGLPIDVQERGLLRPCIGIRSGGTIGTEGRGERGTLGVVVEFEGRRTALTAMHVLAPDVLPVRSSGQRVEWRGAGGPAPIGRVLRGGFDTFHDLALVSLDGVGVELALSTVAVSASEPLAPHRLGAGAPVWLAVDDGGSPVRGRLSQSGANIRGVRLDTGNTDTSFSNLVEFVFERDGIEDGWSGGLVYAINGAPVALLSFAERQPGPDGTRGYGWPLAPFYEAWGLGPAA